MRFLIIALMAVLSNPQVQNDIQARHSRYMERAEVRHLANSVAITANDSRPLAQAVTALSEEYGWAIDFEDPPYHSKYDLLDDTDAKWRAAHTTDKGVTVIAGDTFQTEFPQTPDNSAASAEHILDGVVSDYNASTNPGRFAIRDEGDGRFAVIGIHVKDDKGQDEAVTPVLDTLISIPTETRDGITTIQTIVNAVSLKNQIKIGLFMMPQNALAQANVSVGGENIPARVLLVQALSTMKMNLYWRLYYDHDVKSYGFSLLPVMKANYDTSGKRTTDYVR